MNEKYLEFIQGVINRMCSNSFALKGLAVTLVTAIIGFSFSSGIPRSLVFLALLPAIVFWALDGYYLWQERLYRKLYKAAINKKTGSFTLDVEPFKKDVSPWLCVMFSRTLILFYGVLIAATIIAGVW